MKKLLILIFTIFSLGIFIPSVDASSGKIQISSSSTVVVGNTVTVTVTLSSSSSLGSWEFDVNYDSSYLRLTSSTAENNGTYFVSYAQNGNTKSKTYTLKFRALKSGNTNITVGSYDIYDWDKNSMSISRSNKSIRIMTQAELEASYSKNNNLRDISVTVGEDEYTLDQEFDADILEYNVTVPTGTTLINVGATRADSTATIDGAGEIEVSEGLNTIPIVVTAQNGDEKTYTLVVNVEDLNPINVSIDGENYIVVKSETLLEAPVTFTEATVQIDGFDIPAFTNSSVGYTLVGLKDASGDISLYRYQDGEYSYYNQFRSKSYILVPVDFSSSLDYTLTSVQINGVSYDAYKYSENSNYVIINAINLETNEENHYLYDPSNGAMMIFDDTFINEANQTIEYYTYVIIAFAGALFLMLILIFGLLHSTKKKQKKINQFILKQEAKLEATRKLNDVVSDVQKVIKEDEQQKEEEKALLKSKKELKKEAKRKAKEEKKKSKEEKSVQSLEIEEPIQEDMEKSEDVYDLFEEDKKKKKKREKKK